MSAIRSLTPARAAPRDRRNPDLRQRRHYHEWGAQRQRSDQAKFRPDRIQHQHQSVHGHLSPTTAGALSGRRPLPQSNFGNVAAQTISITGVAYNLASSNTIAPLNFGVLHVGDLTATPMPTITNTAPPGVL